MVACSLKVPTTRVLSGRCGGCGGARIRARAPLTAVPYRGGHTATCSSKPTKAVPTPHTRSRVKPSRTLASVNFCKLHTIALLRLQTSTQLLFRFSSLCKFSAPNQHCTSQTKPRPVSSLPPNPASLVGRWAYSDIQPDLTSRLDLEPTTRPEHGRLPPPEEAVCPRPLIRETGAGSPTLGRLDSSRQGG